MTQEAAADSAGRRRRGRRGGRRRRRGGAEGGTAEHGEIDDTLHADDAAVADRSQPEFDFEDDEAFWSANGIVVVPAPESDPLFPGASASGLSGTMWFHAASPVGHPGAVANNIGTGVHLAEENIADTAQLASH